MYESVAMGKNFSREQGVHSPQNIYVVDTLPTARAEGQRISSDKGFILLEPAATRPPQQTRTEFRRTRSWHSLERSRQSTAMFKRWESGKTRADLLERKASYLGRFQARILTNQALNDLRGRIRQSKLKRTKIKMSPLGFSFGSKPGVFLQNDKVPYQFIPLEDIESLKLDSVAHDVLLCVSRLPTNNNNRIMVNEHNNTTHAYEINAFHMEPRDAMFFQRALNDFKDRGPIYKQMYGHDATTRPRAATVSQDQQLASNGWMESRSMHRRASTGAQRASSPQAYIVEPVVVEARDIVDSPSPQPMYVYDGSLSTGSTTKEYNKPQTKDKGVTVNMHGSSGLLDSSRTQSHTTRVYFLDEVPLADVECQVKPRVTTNGYAGQSRATTSKAVSRETSSTSKEVSSGQFRSRSSSANSRTSKSPPNHNDNDSVKQRIRDLSREFDKLKSMVNDNEQTDYKKVDTSLHYSAEEESISSDSTLQANGPSMRKNYSLKAENVHAGTIDTRAGLVDVHVDSAPKTLEHRSRQDYRSDLRTTGHSGSHSARDQVERRTSERNSLSSAGPSGRYVFYQQVRPVTPEPVMYRRSESPAMIHGRSRSTEPPVWGRKKTYQQVVYR